MCYSFQLAASDLLYTPTHSRIVYIMAFIIPVVETG